MDAYEATRIVFSRIQALDPENASKIMGLLLIQDHGEKEMIRLAFGPESLLHSVVFKARKDLGLSSSASNGGLSISLSLSPTTTTTTTTTTITNNNNNHHHNHHNSSSSTTPTTPSSPSPFFPNPISRQNSISSSRILSNLSPSSPSSWAPPNFPDTTSAAAAAAAAATSYDDLITINNHNLTQSDLMDEFQLHEQLSFLNEAGAAADATIFPSSYPWGPISSGSHRRSNSVTDICGDPLGTGGLGWKPCLYFARGYCKNGTSCRFLHGLPDEGGLVGSPTTAMEQCHQELLLLRSATKTHQQQQQPQQLRLGSNSSQLINSSSFPYPSGKCMNFLLQQQQQQQSDPQRAVSASASAAVAAAALMLGEDVHKFGRLRIDRNEGMVNPGSRQIYLTFPADSTFREEDVSNYFSIYGPVQDVRIPYQQKRMFGFVTFVYPETVKLILAKGNPHFVCDARVLVKPYKEKGKVPDKYRKQQQQQQQQQSGGERGDFSGCSTPTGIDSRDPYDLQQLGGRAFNSTQEMLRRKLEEQQVDLQQAIELQSRRFMGLQLLDVKKHHHQRNLSAGAVPIPSPTHHHHHNHHHHHPLISPHFTNGNHVSIFSQSVGADPDRGASPEGPPPPPPPPQDQQIKNPEEMVNHNDNGSKGNGNDSASIDDCGFHSSLEHNLPDSPFASPKKSNGDSPSSISVVGGSGEGERSNGIAGSSALSSSSSSFLPSSNSNKNLVAASSLLPATSSLDIAPFKSCLLQVPRFSSGHGALGM